MLHYFINLLNENKDQLDNIFSTFLRINVTIYYEPSYLK